jgi:type II restriction/modification system DNA methylase subunit YeeA
VQLEEVTAHSKLQTAPRPAQKELGKTHMNTDSIKRYAPKARTAFIAAMTKRAALFGIRESSIPSKRIEPLEQKGDLALIGERAFPASIIRPRAALVKKVEQIGFAQAIEQAAYSWFNRLCAIRFMELKDYLDHGLRVLSHPEHQGSFQILDDCLDIDLGLDQQRIAELKLDGTKDEELYRELLLAQCHALHQAMPFLFEAIDDATELLLPDNLTKTDSLIRELVDTIPEEDWQDVEIIGWLYQFYISEKKDQVIGKVVKSEDIPAATQLFTPNWIVKYMVQNSLGAQWLATYPDSPLKAQMEYYIEPAEQTAEVQAQLAAITPSQLNPEALTLIDPACGSGHILVEAYDLFKFIYLERGYRQRDVAKLILEKNLFGLDIDERAAQMTGFALMMKGRVDDRRLFERGVTLNVMALLDSTNFDAAPVISGLDLSQYGLEASDLTELTRLFEYATTFGSLIQVPKELKEKLPALKQLSEESSRDLFVAEELKRLEPLVQQAKLLAAQYDAVVANPPYLSTKGMTAQVKLFLKTNFSIGQKDTFAAFMLRAADWTASEASRIGFVTPFAWMYLATFEDLRRHLNACSTIASLVELETNAFQPAMVTVCSFVFSPRNTPHYTGCYIRLVDFKGAQNQAPRTLEAIRNRDCGWFYESSQDDFKEIHGSPVAYWATNAVLDLFRTKSGLSKSCKPVVGLQTGDNERFIRRWSEVDRVSINFDAASRAEAKDSDSTWFPYTKGGVFRKWFGNNESVVNWREDGLHIRECDSSVIRNPDYYFRPGISYTNISSAYFGARSTKSGFIFDQKGSMFFPAQNESHVPYLAFLLSKASALLIEFLCPTMDFNPGGLSALPFDSSAFDIGILVHRTEVLIQISMGDWNAYERSWDFQSLPYLTAAVEPTPTLESSYIAWINQNRATIAEMKRLEEENNRLFIDAYGLSDELTPYVPIEQITLTVNPAYRYGGKMTEEELWRRFREDTMQELVSYAIGCMMGRYSLDAPGLIYAHSSNEGFDPSSYPTFPADDDGIIPLTDKEWFTDDAANRLVEFIGQAWDKTHLEDNLRFLADNLSPKKGEGSRDTLRRYLCDSYFKDHLQTYKKRPIYWLFNSGKQKAFQCLVYLHRYNEGTLARMRTEYVIPLTAKLNSYANKLEQDIDASTSTAEKKALEKQLATLHKQQAELATFDEKLRHCADQRINLDLDDGVKVNYSKFGDLLAEVKVVTGDKAE